MQKFSYIKNIILLSGITAIMGILAFTLERSEINDITVINVNGNKYLDSDEYLKFANLNDVSNKVDLNIALIHDRLMKHPYVKNADVVMLERGEVEVKIIEKKFDAILLTDEDHFLVSDEAEIIPSLSLTRNIDLPIIVNKQADNISAFDNAVKINELMCALKIISAAEVFDNEFCESISEINLTKEKNIIINITGVPYPIYFGHNNEIAKTIYLSKVLKHLQRNDLSKYLNYVDLRFEDLVYLGFNENLSAEKENI